MFACLLALTLLPSPKTPSAKRKWRNARTVGHPRLFPFGCWVNLGNFMGRSICVKCEVVARKGWNTTRPLSESKMFARHPSLAMMVPGRVYSSTETCSTEMIHGSLQRHRLQSMLARIGDACTCRGDGPAIPQAVNPKHQSTGFCTSKSLGFELSKPYIF